jgi:hypothetical protein
MYTRKALDNQRPRIMILAVEILEEEGHCGARLDGSIAKFVSVEIKGGFAAKSSASGAEEFLDVGVGDQEGLAPDVNSVDLGAVGGGRIVAKDPVNNQAKAEDRAEDCIACPLLCAGVFLDPLLLIFEGDSDELGLGEEVRIVMFNNSLGSGLKDESPEHDAFGSSR